MARYRIAGLTVDMEVSGRTARQGAAYAAPDAAGSADITVRCDMQALFRRHPELASRYDDAQYMGTGANFARQLLRFDGLQLHASAVECGGRAYLFSAACGTGKTTHAEKWMRLFGARLMNDDKPALRRLDEGWYAYGTPWSGKGESANISARVGGIAFLRRAEENAIERLCPAQALAPFLSQTPRVLEREQMERLLELADKLLREVPVWRLDCRDDDGAALLARAYMTGEADGGRAER